MGGDGIPAVAGKVAAVVSAIPKDQGGAGQPKRGRPRSKEADRRILRAATDVLADRGLGGMSIEEVASRAGVGKATIYRRWPSKANLALDAFLAESREWLTPADTGTLRGDLQVALQAWVRAVTRMRVGGILAALLAETRQDPELAASWHDQVVEPSRAQYEVILNRAIDRGEIPADTDQDVVLDLLFGSGGYRLLLGHQPLNDHFVHQVVHIITAGLAVPVSEPATQAG
jgi:AcrR family transcriptional regulator